VYIHSAESETSSRETTTAKAHTYLNFNGNTEEAFNFYKSVFGGEFLSLVRFKDAGEMGGAEKLSAADQEKLMHVSLSIGRDSLLMGTDALESMGFKVTMGNNSYIVLEADNGAEADRLFEALSSGGRVEMDLQRTGWAEKYGSFADKFGVQWMVSYTGDVQFEA
jgi:PhnB protein